jgi:diacylglycerol kinase (ATP)
MHAVLIHSSSAGIQSTTADELVRLLKEAGYDDVELRAPKDPDSDDAVRRNADLIVAAGGDGTVTTAILAAPTGARVGVIPLGTANNIANSLGIAGRPEEIIAGWTSAAKKSIDIWRAEGPWGERLFIEGCGVGALTRAAHHMDDKDITGHSPDHEISMGRAALRDSLSHNEAVPAQLTLDDGALEGHFLLLEMLNFGAVGPRLPLAWSADPSDGLLEIGYVLEEHYNDFCEWLSDGASPFAAAPVTLLRSRSVELTWQNARFRIGDEYWPETGMPEWRATHRAAIRLARSGPKVLIPQRKP